MEGRGRGRSDSIRRWRREEGERWWLVIFERSLVKEDNAPNHRGKRLDEAEEGVGLEEELPIHEAVLLAVARRTGEKIGFGLLVAESECGEDIGDGADDDHLQGFDGEQMK